MTNLVSDCQAMCQLSFAEQTTLEVSMRFYLKTFIFSVPSSQQVKQHKFKKNLPPTGKSEETCPGDAQVLIQSFQVSVPPGGSDGGEILFLLPRNPPSSSPRSRPSHALSDRTLAVDQAPHLQHSQTGEESLSGGLVRTNSFIPRLSSHPKTLPRRAGCNRPVSSFLSLSF